MSTSGNRSGTGITWIRPSHQPGWESWQVLQPSQEQGKIVPGAAREPFFGSQLGTYLTDLLLTILPFSFVHLYSAGNWRFARNIQASFAPEGSSQRTRRAFQVGLKAQQTLFHQ